MTRSTASTASVRVVVIGAGIIGASCAAALAEAGAQVVVLEQADQPATGSTGASVAGVRVQFTEEVNVWLSWTSIQTYAEFSERRGVDVGLRPIGYLFLVPEQDWAVHMDGVEVQRRVGAPVEVLDPDAAQGLVPFAVDGIAGATYGPADGIIDPHAVTRAYLDRARAHHASMRFGAPVHLIEPRGTGWRIAYGDTRIDTDLIVNAAGPWSGKIAASAGLTVPVAPVRRSVFATPPLPDPISVPATQQPSGVDGRQRPWPGPCSTRTVPLTADLGTGFFLRGGADHLVYGGSRPDQPSGFSIGLDWQWHTRLREWGAARFPWFDDLPVDAAASWFGYYETTPDHNPVLGRHPDAVGWVDASGFSGHGVQQAPAIGRVIAEEVLAGRASSIDIDELRLDRFRRTSDHAERHVI